MPGDEVVKGNVDGNDDFDDDSDDVESSVRLSKSTSFLVMRMRTKFRGGLLGLASKMSGP